MDWQPKFHYSVPINIDVASPHSGLATAKEFILLSKITLICYNSSFTLVSPLFPPSLLDGPYLETHIRALGSSASLETRFVADDLNPHVARSFYFHMAAGNTLRVKLRNRSQLPTPDIVTQGGRVIKDFTMASNQEEAVHELELQQPLNPLTASFDHGDHTSELPPMMPFNNVAMLSQRRRKKHSSSLKRSASTPNVRGFPNSDAGMTLAEKRRNKLGYHRTSVACGTLSSETCVDCNSFSLSGHCRRRKIRCLLAPDDPQNRCANCIRLKKDCNFFPVDQQPQVERRPRTSSRAETMASSSSDSSPALVGNNLPYLLDRTEDFNAFSQPSLSAPFTSSRGSVGGLISPLTRGER